ncbi:MAG: hypothetical protein HC871_07295 [Rhizobiales bacterium]|nr:hypothetical protein [Hyphomicrobiales bacterium]
MSVYQDIKIAASDGVCALIGPVTPELFEKNCPRFIDGFWVTIELIVLASALGLLIALAAVLARVSGNRLLGTIAYLYIYVVPAARRSWCSSGSPISASAASARTGWVRCCGRSSRTAGTSACWC